jgi:hypothetical protein
MSPLKLIKYLSFCLVMIATCYAQTPVLKLEVSPVLLGGEAKIEFSTSQTECDRPNAVDSIWQGNNFQIYSGPNICQYDEARQWFKYELFVKKLSLQQWFRSELKAVPYGRFRDCFKDIAFTVGDGTTKEQGFLHLPLHALSNDPYLNAMIDEVALGDAVLNVRLGSDQPLQLNIKNNLLDMPLVVRSVKLSYVQPDFWASPEATIDENLKIPQDHTVLTGRVQIRPRPMKVIPNTFFRSKSGDDTRLNLIISYAAHEGGNPRELSSRIKVRFVPSLSYLLLAIVVGALIGAGGRLIDRKARASIKAWLWGNLAAFAGAVILEILGIVLISLNSEFKLFGIALDPFQFPHVLFMAVLVGVLGVNISDVIKHVLKLGGVQQEDRAEAKAQGGKS